MARRIRIWYDRRAEHTNGGLSMPEITAKIKKQEFVRLTAGVTGILLFAWGFSPVFSSRLHVGCVVLMLAGIVLLALCLFYNRIVRCLRAMWKRRGGRLFLSAVCAAGGALFLLFAVLSGMMIAAASAPPPDNATVVVLGAALRGEQPSRMLAARLKTAAAYLKAHPDAPCVVSGGQNDDEVVSEAAAMKQYLVGLGIEESRIYLEDRSTNTRENLSMSRRVIEEHGLPASIAIATQEFHQMRAGIYAQDAGFDEVGALSAHSPLYLLGGYWIRDFAGICRILVLGY